jgi:hypothetical protein
LDETWVIDGAFYETEKCVSFTEMAIPYRNVDLLQLTYGQMIKDTSARLYVVPIDPVVTIQTTPMTLATGLEDPEVSFAYVQPDAKLETFFKDTEKTIADACIEHKNEWFAVAKNLEDDALRRGFKSFFSEQGFKVKVSPDVPCFDASKNPVGREDIPAGTVVRAICELSRVCFGRHEYGSTWKILQLQVVPTECLIKDDPVAEEEESGNHSDSDVDEFL